MIEKTQNNAEMLLILAINSSKKKRRDLAEQLPTRIFRSFGVALSVLVVPLFFCKCVVVFFRGVWLLFTRLVYLFAVYHIILENHIPDLQLLIFQSDRRGEITTMAMNKILLNSCHFLNVLYCFFRSVFLPHFLFFTRLNLS